MAYGYNSFFSFLSLSLDHFLPNHCRSRGILLHLTTLNDTHTHTHSVGLLWTRDRPVTQIST